ncbi:MAG: PAS domain-containing protein, partial [Nitrospirota bacterium]
MESVNSAGPHSTAHAQAALYQFVTRLCRAESLTEVYDAALDAMLNALRCDRASILLCDHAGVMRFVAWRGLSDGYRRAVEGHSPWTPEDADPQPVCMAEVSGADIEDSLKAVVRGEGLAALAFIPLMINGRLRGKFMTYYNAPHVFTSEEITISLAIAQQLALSIARKRTEESLRESEERLRLALDAGRMGTWEWDIKTNRVAWSPGLEAIHGLAPGAFDGSFEAYRKDIHPDDLERVLASIAEVVERGRDHQIEYRIIWPDGSVRWVEGRGKLFRDPSGAPSRMIGVCTDITERKRIEQELLKVGKLESIGVLAGGIAHDFNNILTAIIGNLSIAKIYLGPEHRACGRLEESQKALLRAQSLTQQLLAFSRGGKPVMQPVAIGQLLREAAGFALQGSNVRCEFLIPDDLWPVEADPGQINQAVHNLVLNGRQAMPGGGVIRIQAFNLAVGPENGLPLPNGRYVAVRVADHGAGIAREDLEKIFDPFFTTKPEGTGLGLTTTYRIIKHHRGHIDVQSAAGEGAVVTVYLPRSERAIPAAAPANERLTPGRGRILFMDDEESIRNFAFDVLTHLGYEAAVAQDGREAIELFQKAKERSQPFDAVILDLTVRAGMGGKEAVARLREIDPAVPAIVSSGYSNDPVLADFTRFGF